MSHPFLKKKDYQVYLGIAVLILSIFTFSTLNNSRWDLNTPLHNIDIKFLGSERADKNHAIAVVVLGVCLQNLARQTNHTTLNFEFRKEYWPDSIIQVESTAQSGSIKLALSLAYKNFSWTYTKNNRMQGELIGTRSPWEVNQMNDTHYNIHAYGGALPLHLKMVDGTIEGTVKRSKDFDYQIHGHYTADELLIKITRSYDTFEVFGSFKE